MFKRSSKIPQRNKFSFVREDIIEDVEAIYKIPNERNKLYLCLDETPPSEHKFHNVQKFLKGSQDLEKSSKMLSDSKLQLERLKEEISGKVATLREIGKTALES